MLPPVQQLADFTEGKTQALHLLYEAQPDDGVIGIQPEAANCARWLGKQAAALVEADSIYGEFRQLRHFTDVPSNDHMDERFRESP